MAGFDLQTLGDIDVSGLVKDHESEFSAYMFDRITVDGEFDGAVNGSIRRVESPIGMFSDGGRDAKHAPGAPTPKGEIAMGSVTCALEPYSWAESINHLARKEAERIPDLISKMGRAGGHMVMGSLDKEAARILGGGGAAATSDNLDVYTAGAAWDVIATDARADLEEMVDKLRGGSQGLKFITGWDVLRDLSKNTSMINDTQKKSLSMEALFDELRGIGIEEVVADYVVSQDGARTAPRNYKGLFNGLAALTTGSNLLRADLGPLAYDVYYDDDTRTWFFRAARDADLVRGYAGHTLRVSGNKT